MKALFKLKEKQYSFEEWMTNEQAEKEYQYSSKYPKELSSSLYLKSLNFEQWLVHYSIKIL